MAGPTTLVIFGASGDLASRKILPAVYWLAAARKLPEDFHIIGVARSDITPDGLIAKVGEHVPDADAEVLQRLTAVTHVAQMDSKDSSDYGPLHRLLHAIEGDAADVTRLLHVAIPPSVAFPVVEALKEVGLIDAPNIATRLLMEKPFGFDLQSAEELEADVDRLITGDQLYRIDHYLGKKDVQSLLRMHFDDEAMRARWNSEHIAKIEIEASEAMGIEGRAAFYEQTGALRDVVQSHVLSLLALTLMAVPPEPTPAAFCAERASVLAAVALIPPDEIAQCAVRGQYEGYREEVDNHDSITETYAALKLHLDTPRWRGMTILVGGGKGVAELKTEIRIFFKDQDGPMVIPITSGDSRDLHRMPDGYERVILDAIHGDQTNTTSSAEVLASWRLLDPVLHAWARSGDGLVVYPKGSRPLLFGA